MKYIFWDFDNTLAYREGMWSDTILEILTANGYKKIRIEDIRSLIPQVFPWNNFHMSHVEFFKGEMWWDYMNKQFEDLMIKLGVEKKDSYRLSKLIREYYLSKDKWKLYEDSEDCLKVAINKGYSNIIVSNHVPELEELVVSLGIRDYFYDVHTSALLGYEKPNIKLFTKVIDKLKKPDYIVMVGDNYHADVLGALDAGIDAILVRNNNINNYEKYFSNLIEISEYM